MAAPDPKMGQSRPGQPSSRALYQPALVAEQGSSVFIGFTAYLPALRWRSDVWLLEICLLHTLPSSVPYSSDNKL